MTDKNLVISLVRNHLLENPEYQSWIPAYSSLRTLSNGQTQLVIVGGHYRRKALYKKAVAALSCTCKLHQLSAPHAVAPPLDARRGRDRTQYTIV